MRDSIHIPEADLTLYALGAFSPQQLSSMTAHISMCSECREELARCHMDAAAYGASFPLEELPTGARDRFMTRLANNDIQVRGKEPAAWERARGRFYILRKITTEWTESVPVLRLVAAALLIAAVVAGFDDYSRQRQVKSMIASLQKFEADSAELDAIESLLHATNATDVVLREGPPPTTVVPPPEARAIYSSSTGRLILTASHLRPLPKGKAYELWVLPVSGDKPVPAGTFAPDESGNAALILPDLPMRVAAKGFGVTVEAATGSPVPTSPIVLSGF